MYTVPATARQLGISRTAILSWIEKDFIRPAVRSLGKGDSTMLDDANLRQLRIVGVLARCLGDGEMVPGIIRDAVAKVRPSARVITLQVEVSLG